MEHMAHDESSYVGPLEVAEMELYHPKTFLGKYIWSQDAKVIAIQYAVTAISIGLVALVLSWMMRLQLAYPNSFSFIDPSNYLQAVTMHGMIMVVYLLTALFLGGFGNYLIPLMVGARDMVFPYLNMLSFWIYLFAVILLVISFFVPGGPTGSGWTLYPPQAILPGTPGATWGIIFMLVSLIFFIIGFTMGGLNYVVTILQARTRGMTLMRMPLTIWGIFVATILALLAFPALFVSAVMMLFDLLLGTSFFMPALVSMGQQASYTGGSPLLFQHLFWFFGHPEVYILALPFFGIATEILPVFSRKPIFGYKGLIAATIAIAALSVAVWAHHMYASGQVLLPFFSFMTFLIAVPTGVKFFNWIGTMWRGSVTFETPMLFVLGFLITFLFGGLTGVILASPPLDFAVSASYFVVAHFHYVLFGTVVFAMFAGFYFWWPKFTGRMLDETLGKIHFWTLFFGFHLTFLIQHWLGIKGFPRRYADYLASDGFTFMNMVSTVGSGLLALSMIPFFLNIWQARNSPMVNTDDPWGYGSSLEWATSCPPPRHNFTSIPRIRSERPAFDLHYPHMAQKEKH